MEWPSLLVKSEQISKIDWSQFQIRLQIKRTVPRQVTELLFHDRNVDDAPDGYVSCDSYKDNREWRHVEKMERGMQGVPILVGISWLGPK